MLRRQIRNPWQSRTPKESPLTDNPLRNPGQSLDEAIQTLLGEDVLGFIIAILFCNVMTAYEWWRWYTKMPYSPGVLTLFCVVVTAFSTSRLCALKKQLKTLRLARDGEKAVGQYLEMLRETGYRVFHDVSRQKFQPGSCHHRPQRHFHYRDQNL